MDLVSIHKGLIILLLLNRGNDPRDPWVSPDLQSYNRVTQVGNTMRTVKRTGSVSRSTMRRRWSGSSDWTDRWSHWWRLRRRGGNKGPFYHLHGDLVDGEEKFHHDVRTFWSHPFLTGQGPREESGWCRRTHPSCPRPPFSVSLVLPPTPRRKGQRRYRSSQKQTNRQKNWSKKIYK